MIKAIIFDFDGVIAESVDVKTEAFCELYNDYPNIQDDVRKYHLDNGGMSRVKKFYYYEQNLLGRELTQKKLEQLCNAFHDLVIEKVVQAPYVKGAKEVLDEYFEKCLCFVASGTPDEEIKEVVVKRNLTKYFREVFGSPESKTDITKRIMKNYSLNSNEVVFIGDAKSDLKAAKETGITFVARKINYDHDWYNDKYISKKFNDLEGVNRYLKEIT